MPPGAANSPKPCPLTARRAEFESLYEGHSRAVWAVVYARWLNAELALDVMQEAFLRLWNQWEIGGEDIQNPRAWLLRVARNLSEDHAKSAFRRNGTQPPELLDAVRSPQPLPEEVLERNEQFARLRAELEALSPADRDVLTLRYAMDYDANEIAAILEVNVTAVHMRLSRARQRLAERLGGFADFAPQRPHEREPRP